MEHFKNFWRYDFLLGQSVAFVKITKEFDANGKKHVEGIEINGFDYDDFFRRLSEKLPKWMAIRLNTFGQKHYTFSNGRRFE